MPALAAAILTLSPALASAAPTEAEKIESKSAYADARAAAAAGRHADAVKLFKRADELDPNPQYRLEIAKSLVADAKLLEANKVLSELVNASPPVIWPVKSAAEKMLAEVEPKIPWIQIKVIGPDLRLTSTTIDGKEIDAENEIPYNPGEHVVAADADGYEPAEKTITLAEGAHEVVELNLKRIGGPRPPKPGTTATTTPPSGDGSGGTTSGTTGATGTSSTSSTTGISRGGAKGGGGDLMSGPFFIPMVVGGSVGVAGLGVGTVFGILALTKASEAKEDCKGNTCPDTVKVRRARDASVVNGNVSTIAFIAGGVGIATAATMLILQLNSSPPPKKEQAFVRPFVGVGQAGVFGAF